MTNQQILKKAIEKAVKNGYKLWGKHFKIGGGAERCEVWVTKTSDENYSDKYLTRSYDENTIIFSHDFAKAVFGEEEIEYEVSCEPLDLSYQVYEPAHKPSWQYHLQQMVLEKDPIKYLEKFL